MRMRQGEKGSGIHWAFVGLVSEFCCANQIHAMWLTCNNHVTMRNNYLLLHMTAIDAFPCQNDALSCHSHDMLHPARPKKRSMYNSLMVGFGNKTTNAIKKHKWGWSPLSRHGLKKFQYYTWYNGTPLTKFLSTPSHNQSTWLDVLLLLDIDRLCIMGVSSLSLLIDTRMCIDQ